ncbi:MAG: ABC transporter permease, partial [Rothia mucilaginosa]|nr:ABC transporter permease [Rothia mucilaginosa]
MSNTARTENNRAAENPVEENRAEGIRMEERAANTRPKVSSIDEDEEYIPPRANYPLVRVIEQGRYETMAMLRNGEQLMLNIIFPVMALFALRFTGLIDEYANSVGVSRMDAAVPGVLALCVISTALSGQGIATGFDRRYGVLRFLATTPLGRNGLIMGKCIAVLVVVAI